MKSVSVKAGDSVAADELLVESSKPFSRVFSLTSPGVARRTLPDGNHFLREDPFMNITHVLFSPNGRIGQQEFWIGGAHPDRGPNIVAGFIPILGFLISLGLIWVGIAVYGKRLHDAGKERLGCMPFPWAVSFVLLIIGHT